MGESARVMTFLFVASAFSLLSRARERALYFTGLMRSATAAAPVHASFRRITVVAARARVGLCIILLVKPPRGSSENGIMVS